MQSSSIQLSVVIPAYNEAERIRRCLYKTAAYLMGRAYRSEMIIVENGSTDDTAELVERILRVNVFKPVEVKLIRLEQAAKGLACRVGIRAARGQFVYLQDVDLAVDPVEICTFRMKAAMGADLVLGDRSACPMSPLRALSSHIFHAITRGLVHVPDTQCGFKMLRRDSVAPLLDHSMVDGFGWDVELVHLAELHRLKICSIPVNWRNDRNSRVRLVRDSLRMIGEVYRIRHTHHKEVKATIPVTNN